MSNPKQELRKLLAKSEEAEKQRLANMTPKERRTAAAILFARSGIERAVKEGNPVGISATQKVLEFILAGDAWWIDFAVDTVEVWIQREHLKLFSESELTWGQGRRCNEQLRDAQARVDGKLAELKAVADGRELVA